MDSGNAERVDSYKPNWIRKTADLEKEEATVTARKYEEVKTGLRLPDNYVKAGDKVLSVGEGLSDFARVLRQQTQADVWSIDPIYALGSEVLQQDPKKAQEALTKAYGDRVFLRNPRNLGSFSDSDTLPLPDPKRIVAGSVYELPFANKTFNLILSNKVFEHIDFSQALMELVYALKPHGEIRMGGLRLHVNTREGTVSAEEMVCPSNFEYYFRPHPGLGVSLQILSNHSFRFLSTYILINSRPGAKVGRARPDVLLGTVLIIRNDKQLPRFTLSENQSQDRYMDQIVRLSHIAPVTTDGERLYKISEPLS